MLQKNGIVVNIADDECDFLDSIYLPSKYPIGSALPVFYPDKEICKSSIVFAKRVIEEVKEKLT